MAPTTTHSQLGCGKVAPGVWVGGPLELRPAPATAPPPTVVPSPSGGSAAAGGGAWPRSLGGRRRLERARPRHTHAARARPPRPCCIKRRRAARAPSSVRLFGSASIAVYGRSSDSSSQNGEADREQGTRSRGRPGAPCTLRRWGRRWAGGGQAARPHPWAKGTQRLGLGLREARAWVRPRRSSMPWRKRGERRGPPGGRSQGAQRCLRPVRPGDALARGAPVCLPAARSASPGPGNPDGVRGWREAPLSPICIPIRVRARRWRAPWRKHGVAGRHSLLGERRDPPALGGVSSLGSGSRPETPGCLHRCRAAEITGVVSAQRGRSRAGDPARK